MPLLKLLLRMVTIQGKPGTLSLEIKVNLRNLASNWTTIVTALVDSGCTTSVMDADFAKYNQFPTTWLCSLMVTVTVLFKVSAQRGSKNGVRDWSPVEIQRQAQEGSKGRWGTDGTAASTYVLCHHVYMCPNLPDGTIPYDGDASEMRF